jgi:glycosyltransferase involved in cell wall biosynthesis
MLSTVQITPSFAPRIDGVGDYARLLGENLLQFGVNSRFVVGDPDWTGEGHVGGQAATNLSSRTTNALVEELASTSSVLVHYVGYGYDSSGIPTWLSRALARWKAQSAAHRLVIVFHELWASGPPWKREFYTSLLQRRIAVQLQRLCDAAVTSVAVMQRTLERIESGKTTHLPIPSAFPTASPDERKSSTDGRFSVAVFGQEASRHLSVQKHQLLLRSLHSAGLLGKIRVFGRNAAGDPKASSDVALLGSFLPKDLLDVIGDVSPDRGGHLLASSDMFLSYYPSEYLCKSSALMAAMACGCVPVLPEARCTEPLTDRREILACGNSPREVDDFIVWLKQGHLREVSQAGAEWYRRNVAWDVVAGRVARILRGE